MTFNKILFEIVTFSENDKLESEFHVETFKWHIRLREEVRERARKIHLEAKRDLKNVHCVNAYNLTNIVSVQ